MAETSATFSESWYRIADKVIYLRPGIKVRRQYFRGERWFVLENPFNNQFFRIRPEAYEFVSRLNPRNTVQEVWDQCMVMFPETAPGQEAVIQLLSQLYHASLLQYQMPSDSAELFRRYKKRRQREVTGKLMNLMFIRFPLLDPDRFLVKTLPIVGKLISKFGFILWLVVVGFALKLLLDHAPQLKDESQGILSPGNLPLLYLGLVILKTLHEFGHAYFCRKFGGEVHVMGVMLMIFTPIPYMDATSSWGFRSRWQRALVGLAGMIVEVFVAAVAIFFWVNTSPGLVHNLAYNMMVVASVSTVLFNINPLLRFDGYYILSDLLDYPNLHQQSGAHLLHLFKRYAFGIKKSHSPTDIPKEKAILTTFGILSHIYRIFVFSAILLFVADRFLILGIIMAIICLVSWIFVPLGKFIYFLLESPQLERTRFQAWSVTVAFIMLLVLFLNLIPFPSHFRAEGVVHTRQWSQLVNETGGQLVEILGNPGEEIKKGQVLLKFENESLKLQILEEQARLKEIESKILLARQSATPDIFPLEKLRDSVDQNLRVLNKRLDSLVVKAPHDGYWVNSDIQDFLGRWMVRGSSLGLLVNTEGYQFVSPVMQTEVDRLFSAEIHRAEVRLYGAAEKVVVATDIEKIPAEKNMLPSAALGWFGGGAIAVDSSDAKGLKTLEPFFEVRTQLPNSGDVNMVYGRTGKIRFKLDSEPLWPRLMRRLRQTLQKRYQI